MAVAPISRFPVSTLESLPEDIRARILSVQEKAGFVPNVFIALAHRPAEWRAFVEEQVTPRFPDGFTVQDVLGQYRGRDGRIIAEPSKILLVIHGADARPRAAIQEIRDTYRRLFQQESVLLIESPARAGF